MFRFVFLNFCRVHKCCHNQNTIPKAKQKNYDLNICDILWVCLTIDWWNVYILRALPNVTSFSISKHHTILLTERQEWERKLLTEILLRIVLCFVVVVVFVSFLLGFTKQITCDTFLYILPHQKRKRKPQSSPWIRYTRIYTIFRSISLWFVGLVDCAIRSGLMRNLGEKSHVIKLWSNGMDGGYCEICFWLNVFVLSLVADNFSFSRIVHTCKFDYTFEFRFRHMVSISELWDSIWRLASCLVSKFVTDRFEFVLIEATLSIERSKALFISQCFLLLLCFWSCYVVCVW